MQAEVEASYEAYNFHQIYQRLHHFCVVEMGGFYLDILKDRLYTMPADSKGRLSAQTAMHHILETLVRLFAPVISFTAEEIWGHMADMQLSSDRDESVLLATRYSALDELSDDELADNEWQKVIQVREEVLKEIEQVRVAGDIGSALDARIEVYADGDYLDALSKIKDEFRFVLLSSDFELGSFADAPADAKTCENIANLKVLVKPIDDPKCVRCWHRRSDVGGTSF